MPTPNYKWPTYDIAPQEHLQALGAISLNFNLYESGFRGFLHRYMPSDLAELLFDKLDSDKRQKLILEVIASMEPDSEVREYIEFLIRHFSACTANRNILLHARVRGTPSDDVLPLEKNDRNEPGKILQYDIETCDLRRAADEMRAGYNFMIGILQFLIQRETERNIDHSFSSPFSASPKPALPNKPSPARSLDNTRRPEAQ
jgi:hypothetical protein